MNEDRIWVVTVRQSTTLTERRELIETQIDVGVLSGELQSFLSKLGSILTATPKAIGDYELDEIELSAEVSASGTIKILGSGIESSLGSGLKFVFRRKA
ncbi:hypothetical protein [Leptolyngbya sp. CCY15150]|uniref:Pepco domain-containing protein n=1 Tax=Leptolyngbya sp. CCY15150 TaxID=2767772 RepID=UPI00194F58A2|nr:hypothetical protein [Leptolyngbya sp. CCY15150]